MSRRVKLKSKDAAALDEFVRTLRSALGENLLEMKLQGHGKRSSGFRHRCARRRESKRCGDRGSLTAPSCPILCGALLLFYEPLQKTGLLCEAGT
jgi:hypothetical protein